MMRQEYEELSGIRIGCLFYDEMLEPMYNALPEFIYKQDFANFIDARKAQALFYKEMINKGSLEILSSGTLLTLFNDLKYLEVIDKAFPPDKFIYCDTDSVKAYFNRRYGSNVTKEAKE